MTDPLWNADEPIDPEVFADFADDALIERGWERLEASLEARRSDDGDPAGGGDPGQPSQGVAGGLRFGRSGVSGRPRMAAVPALAAAAVMGLAIGAGVTYRSMSTSTPRAGVVAETASGGPAAPAVVLAAGIGPRHYTLPGGGHLQLDPGSIVDTIQDDQVGAEQRPGGGGTNQRMVLRLVRGTAKLTTARPDAGGPRVNYMVQVGQALVETVGGTIRMSHHGKSADVEVLSGSARVTSPDGAEGQRRVALGAGQQTRVLVELPIAKRAENDRGNFDPRQPQSHREHDDQSALPDPEVDAPVAMAEELPIAVAAKSPWMAACDVGDYRAAIELLPANFSAVNLTNASYLMCIGSGREVSRDRAGAIAILERVVAQHPDDPYAVAAAANLARMHRSAGNQAEADRYAKLRLELSKGSLLPATALCKKIQGEAAAKRDDAAELLIERYLSQYPDGPCTDTIDILRAQFEARRNEAAAKPGAHEGKPGESDGPAASDAPAKKSDAPAKKSDAPAKKSDAPAKKSDGPAPSGSAEQAPKKTP